MDILRDYFNSLNNPIIITMIIFIGLDIFLGSIRALKEKEWNSTIGINGMLRKIAMIGSIFFLALFDNVLELNLLGFVPEEALAVFKLERVATSELFGLMFALYEVTSILKNAVLCELPVPKGLKEKVEAMLKNMTTELDKKEK